MSQAFRSLGKLLGKGLLAVLPVALTLAALFWLAAKAESIFGWPLKTLLPHYYVVGTGILIGLVVTVFVGIAVNFYIGRKLLDLANLIVSRIPLLKTLYNALRDLLSLFGERKKTYSEVVLVQLPGSPGRQLGLLTCDSCAAVMGLSGDHVAVYVPMSYQLGGFTYIVPRSSLEKVNMSVEEALRFAITAGVSSTPATPVAPATGDHLT